MKAIFLALFVVAVTAAPLPEDLSGSDAVEMVVNGMLDGTALEVSDTVDIKLKEHANGAVVATNLLHPYTAVGIAEAAAAAPVSNDVSVVDSDMAAVPRNVHPMPIVIPSIPVPDAPEIMISEPIVMPPPALPEPIVMPPPVVQVDVEPEQLPVAAPQYNGQLYNDGLVQVQYNGPQEPGMLSTLQSWFNTVVNYFNSPSSSYAAPELRH